MSGDTDVSDRLAPAACWAQTLASRCATFCTQLLGIAEAVQCCTVLPGDAAARQYGQQLLPGAAWRWKASTARQYARWQRWSSTAGAVQAVRSAPAAHLHARLPDQSGVVAQPLHILPAHLHVNDIIDGYMCDYIMILLNHDIVPIQAYGIWHVCLRMPARMIEQRHAFACWVLYAQRTACRASRHPEHGIQPSVSRVCSDLRSTESPEPLTAAASGLPRPPRPIP